MQAASNAIEEKVEKDKSEMQWYIEFVYFHLCIFFFNVIELKSVNCIKMCLTYYELTFYRSVELCKCAFILVVAEKVSKSEKR